MSKMEYTESDILNAFISHSDVMIFWKDRERRFVGASKSFLEFYGLQLEDIVGKNDEEMGWHINPIPYQNDEQQIINTGIPIYDSAGKCIIKGIVRHIIATKLPIRNKEGEIVGLVGYFRDVTDQKNDIDDLITKTITDELTGLTNQRGLNNAVEEYVEEYNSRGVDFAVITLNIRNFSEYNDTYGRDFGDDYLKMVADDLLQICRNTSVVARLSGNYFVIMRQIPVSDTIPKISENILTLLDHIRLKQKEIRMINNHSFRMELSVGWAAYSEYEDVRKTFHYADSRMYADK